MTHNLAIFLAPYSTEYFQKTVLYISSSLFSQNMEINIKLDHYISFSFTLNFYKKDDNQKIESLDDISYIILSKKYIIDKIYDVTFKHHQH